MKRAIHSNLQFRQRSAFVRRLRYDGPLVVLIVGVLMPVGGSNVSIALFRSSLLHPFLKYQESVSFHGNLRRKRFILNCLPSVFNALGKVEELHDYCKTWHVLNVHWVGEVVNYALGSKEWSISFWWFYSNISNSAGKEAFHNKN